MNEYLYSLTCIDLNNTWISVGFDRCLWCGAASEGKHEIWQQWMWCKCLKRNKKKVKQSHYRPRHALSVPGGEAPRFQDNRHRMVVRLSALRTGHLYPQEIFTVLISVRGWVNPRTIVRPEGLCQMKNSNDTIRNRTRDLPVCSAMPQPTAPPRVPSSETAMHLLKYVITNNNFTSQITTTNNFQPCTYIPLNCP